MKKILHSLALLLSIALLSFVAGCKTTAPPTAIKTIQVVGEVDANTNSATAIDLVYVYDSNVLGLLPATGPDWFDKKDALMKALAKSIEVTPLQVPPSTLVNVPLPANYAKAIGIYSYANYLTAGGQPQCNLTPYKTMVIWLTPDAVVCSGNK